MYRVQLRTSSSDETKTAASAISPTLIPGDVVALSGPLGAGKTTFVQGLATGLGIHERVSSPTFILMREYLRGRLPLVHLDVYRLDKVHDFLDLGIEEYFDPSCVVVIEWGDVVEPLLPASHLIVQLERDGDAGRRVTLTATGPSWDGRHGALSVALNGVTGDTKEK